jgi:divalent metal cation (Fe/Co/Zn/Cd) transporter
MESRKDENHLYGQTRITPNFYSIYLVISLMVAFFIFLEGIKLTLKTAFLL